MQMQRSPSIFKHQKPAAWLDLLTFEWHTCPTHLLHEIGHLSVGARCSPQPRFMNSVCLLHKWVSLLINEWGRASSLLCRNAFSGGLSQGTESSRKRLGKGAVRKAQRSCFLLASVHLTAPVPLSQHSVAAAVCLLPGHTGCRWEPGDRAPCSAARTGRLAQRKDGRQCGRRITTCVLLAWLMTSGFLDSVSSFLK